MKNITAKELLKKYKGGTCTEAELALLESWYLTENAEQTTPTLDELNTAKNQVWLSLPLHEEKKIIRKKLWFGIPPIYTQIAAAAIIILSAVVILQFNSSKTITNEEAIVLSKDPILPGGKKATLTLANGKSILLNDVNSGKITSQGGSNVIKTEDGQLAYNTTKDKRSESLINILTIPTGGYYILTLADGTKVWLNSESSLKYPTNFVSDERIVELSGEAYFEVAHRKNQPFKVITNKQTVEVLGTHFNVNAYNNEKVSTTTLLKGSVKVAGLILKPGEQVTIKNGKSSVTSVNTEDAIAWVNNDFNFNNEELGSIMRKISRWYDVEVVCPADLEHIEFMGTVSRTKKIQDVIKIMEKTNTVHFKVQGRRITVMH